MKLYVASLAVINREIEYTDQDILIKDCRDSGYKYDKNKNYIIKNIMMNRGLLCKLLGSDNISNELRYYLSPESKFYELKQYNNLIVRKNLDGTVTDMISDIKLPLCELFNYNDEFFYLSLSKKNERVYAKLSSHQDKDYINKMLEQQTISSIKKQYALINKIINEEEPYRKENLSNRQLVKRIEKLRKQGIDKEW